MDGKNKYKHTDNSERTWRLKTLKGLVANLADMLFNVSLLIFLLV